MAVFAMAVKSIGEHSKDNENYREMMARYVEDKRRYDQDTQSDKVRVENQLVEKAALEENLSVLKGQLIQSRANLEKIYSQDVIFPKYRNLVMVCSIYEYICAGRCTQLEGHEGAYNILEMEIRMDRIITQLDTIISRLSAIQQNQYVLYSAIQESNRKAESLCSAATSMAKQIEDMNAHQKLSSQQLQDQISRLQQTSEISTYQSERIQKELSYMNRMNYLAGRNDGTFFNLPPT